jgi:iron-sulfur cluster assembly accessory protein
MADVPQTDTRQPAADADTPLLTITPVARQKVRDLLAERELEGFALRVFVQGGGCSGLSYGMGFEENIYDNDHVIDAGDGVRLVIDPASLSYMRGAEIDFVDNLMGGGFAIHNPNAVASCGCGHSFRTSEEEQQASGATGGCSSCG